MEEIETIQQYEKEYYDNIQSICSEGTVNDIFEMKKRILDIKEEIDRLSEKFRDDLFTVVSSCLTRKRYSVSNTCTIRNEDIYIYNDSNRLPLENFISSIDEIREDILPDKIRSCHLEDVEEIFDFIQERKELLNDVANIEDFNISKRADDVPESFRPDTYYTRDYFYLNLCPSPGEVLIVRGIYSNSEDGIERSKVDNFSSNDVHISPEMSNNKISDIDFLFNSKNILYDLMVDFESRLESMLSVLRNLIDIIGDRFSKTLVLEKI